MEDLNIRELREIAEKATPGPWIVSGARFKWRTAHSARELDSHAVGPDGEAIGIVFYDPKQHAACWADARFIATFDPPTVLALLSSAEAREEAERRLKAWDRQWPTYVKLMDEHVARAEFLLALALACAARGERDANYNARASQFWQAQHLDQAAALQAAETRAQQAEARVEELTKALREVNRCASPDGSRTMDDMMRALDWITAHARQALGASHG